LLGKKLTKTLLEKAFTEKMPSAKAFCKQKPWEKANKKPNKHNQIKAK